MTILCGTDFSEPASAALTAAAALAARMKMPLHVIHAIEVGPKEPHEQATAHAAWARKQLEQEAQSLRALGATVTVQLRSGAPDDALLAEAAEVSAKLIVTAALGNRRPGKWQLGSHSERLAQHSHVPVLVVRSSEPFSAWARGERPLRVAFGADLSQTSAAAIRWVDALRAFGPCDVVAIHLYWPPAQFQRLGLVGVRDYLEPDPQVNAALEHELRNHLELPSGLGGTGGIKVRLEPHLGRVGDRLAAIAKDERADLVLVGTHDRNAAGRLWEGSVSRDVLHEASASVACIPSASAAASTAPQRLRSIVVATDFSVLGNAAIPLAYGVAGPGTTVHLVHVVQDRVHNPVQPHDVLEAPAATSAVPEHLAAREHLAELIPRGILGADKASRVHILESNYPAEAICQAAERFDADLVCLGTHGRRGVSQVALGSVAMSVVSHTKRPVLLTHEPRE